MHQPIKQSIICKCGNFKIKTMSGECGYCGKPFKEKRVFEFSMNRCCLGIWFTLFSFNINQYWHRDISFTFCNMNFNWYYPNELEPED